jgi:hypothetical protein
MGQTSFRYSTNLVIPDTSAVKDAVAQQELTYILTALRTLATRLDETTGSLSPPVADWPNTSPAIANLGNNIYKFYAFCDVAINFGMFVNFHNLSATSVAARPAQANTYLNAAGGYCVDPNGVAAGSWGEFQVGPGLNYGIAGLVPGNWYFLSPFAPGVVTATQPTTPGQIIQLLGQAVTDRILMCGALNTWLAI